MENLLITAQERSPHVEFNFTTGLFTIVGESYPDDASKVFGPIFDALDSYLSQVRSTPVRFEIELVYFNSSSAKALMNMFKRLEAAAAKGQKIDVYWRFAADDETMREFGEDFSEDLSALTFHLVETDGE
jgi:hypothetical protein